MPVHEQTAAFQLDQQTIGELRASQRQAYGYRQQIAPLFGNRMPSPKWFFEVPCGDISSSGFSFYLDTQPEFEKLVVALGCPPEIMYMAAQVVHVKPVVRNGKAAFRVGCCFSHRIYS